MDAIQNGGADTKTAIRVYEILKNTSGELQELGMKAGGDLLEKHPKLKESVGSGYEQLKKIAEERGPQAKKILEDTTNQVCIASAYHLYATLDSHFCAISYL